MLRAVIPSGRVALKASVQPFPSARGMATAQALRQRIQSVKNIKKITAAMKMVAVCKLRIAQENLAKARQFQAPLTALNFKPKDANAKADTQLWIGISSDRGLCGAINSSITRGVRDSIYKAQAEGMANENVKVLLIGEKCKQGLERLFKANFQFTLTETAKFKPCTFKQCAELTDYWSKQEVSKTSVFFQKFQSMIAYNTTQDVFWSFAVVKDDAAAEFAEFELEGGSDVLENLYQFRQCVKLYHYFAENETSTLSARMAAMDNSSKNAKDMIEKLSLVLNRNRQSKITTELSEIISGAAASEEQK